MKTIKTILYSYLALASVLAIFYVANDFKYKKTEKNKTTLISKKESQPEKIVVPENIDFIYGRELLNKLKAGGLVVYFRHFATDHRSISKDGTRPRHSNISIEELTSSCDIQRPLSEYGRLQAKLVNKGINANQIPIGQVLSSPYCRTMEGAQIAFNTEPQAIKNLIYRTDEFPPEITSRFIVKLLGEEPTDGNTFIMSHRPQMDDLGNIEEGEAYVFEPTENGKFNFIGTIQPSEWLLASFEPDSLSAAYLQKNVYSKRPKKQNAETEQGSL